MNPAAIAAGVAAAQQVIRGGKAIYNEIRPKRRPRRPNPAPRRNGAGRVAGVALAKSATPSVARSTYSRVEKRVENVGSFTSSGTTLNMYLVHVQPGDSDAFPWLATVAPGYSMHRFRRLRYRLAPSVATSTPGRVTLAPVYAGGSPPATTAGLNNLVGARSSAVWDEFTVDLDIKAMYPFGQYKKIATAAVSDQTNSDAAHLYVAFDGVASGVSVSLWVEYEVELFMPRPEIPTDVVNAHSIVTVATDVLSTAFEKQVITLTSFNPFQLVQVDASNILLPAGLWEIECSMEFSTSAGMSTGAVWCRTNLGDNTSEFTDPYQLPGLKSHTYFSGYHVTGSTNLHGFFDKLLYVSDGVTPLCLWIDASINQVSVTSHSRLLISPIG